MSLLQAIRDRLTARFGTSQADDSTTDADGPDAAASAVDTDEERKPQLDPEAVTETRTAATDDAVDALQSLQESGDVAAADSGAADSEATDSEATDAENDS